MPLTIKTGAMKVKDPSTGNYVDVDMSLGVDYAPIISPTFTGTPSAPTPASTDDSTRIATTEFVQDHVDELEAADASLQGSLNSKVLTPSSAKAIPSSGSSATYTLAGLTADYVLVRWGFSSSAENSPPTALTWTTSPNQFVIQNTGSVSPSETIKPVFALPNAI